MARDVLKNYALFVDGRNYVGQCSSFTPPVLSIKTEDYRAGGMDAPEEVDHGMEKLEASFELLGFDADVLTLTGFVPGAEIMVQARGALESEDGTSKADEITMRGKIRKADQGTWKAGEATPLSVEFAPHYYRQAIDGVEICEIDVRNMIRKIGGVDQLEGQRAAMGI